MLSEESGFEGGFKQSIFLPLELISNPGNTASLKEN